MFTGLIQALATVKSADRLGRAMRLTIELTELPDQVTTGDSIAVNGCCLTVTRLTDRAAAFDISPETIIKTNLGKLTRGKKVNIELALRPTDRLGGHFVTGHIDGVAVITEINKQQQFANIKFKAPPELLEQIIQKGSVAVDGISLTVAEITTETFTVALIPETLVKTTLGNVKAGDTVNIETDIIVKTIKKHLKGILPKQQNLTIEKLKQSGF